MPGSYSYTTRPHNLLKMTAFWDNRNLVEVGGSKHLWNVGKLLPDYRAQHPRRQPSSYSPPWEPEISQIVGLFNFVFYIAQITQHRNTEWLNDKLWCMRKEAVISCPKICLLGARKSKKILVVKDSRSRNRNSNLEPLEYDGMLTSGISTD
jgi:hypothetical protein